MGLNGSKLTLLLDLEILAPSLFFQKKLQTLKKLAIMDILLKFGIGNNCSTFGLLRYHYRIGFFPIGFAENLGLQMIGMPMQYMRCNFKGYPILLFM